jgi:hypothetical protein
MSLRALPAALVLAVASSTAAASDVLGYSEAFDTLFQVNLTAHTAAERGPAGNLNGTRIADLEGLSFAPNGNLYAVSDDLRALFSISAQNGHATLIGPLNLVNEPTGLGHSLDLGMTVTCDGRFWLSAADGNFWQLDPSTGAATQVGNLGVRVTGLAAKGNEIYAAGSQGNNNLYLVDPDTATATLIGAYKTANYVTTVSPGFDASGKLWSVLNYVPPPQGSTSIPPWSDAATIDASSGVLRNTGSIVGPSDLQSEFFGELKGLAIVPPSCVAGANPVSVPALPPKGLALLAGLLALGAAAGTRLKRRRQSR